MKRSLFALAAAIALLVTACGTDTLGNTAVEEPVPTDTAVIIDGPPWFATFRVVDTYENGSGLLLAKHDGGAGEVYYLNVADKAPDAPVRDGDLINVCFETILETYPAQFGGVSKIEHTQSARDDRCGLYLQVLEDLWETDPGLNTGISELGVDLSGVTDLTGAEKAAVIHRFGEKHGLFPVTGTWEELCEQGYIDRENLFWEDGCLFTVEGTAEEFQAEKWASGLGAYFFLDCTGESDRDGAWTYAIGGHAIS